MKMGSRRSSTAAVLETPEESYASDLSGERASRGRDRRASGADEDVRSEVEGAEALERPAFSRRSARAPKGQLRLRFGGIPKTLGGRILAGSAVVLLLGVTGAAALVARQYLLHSERFLLASSDNIEFVGNHQLTRAQGMSAFADDLDRNIFHMSLAQREADLERLPWVQHATVMRLLPNRIRVEISERTPVAFARQGTQNGLVDAEGVLLDMPSDAAGNPNYSFPVLTGVSGTDPLSTRKARMELYLSFLKAMRAGGEQVVATLSEVDVTDPEDVKAVVFRDGSDVLVHFGQENFLERYKTFDEHLAEWKQTYPKLLSADMRYNNQILLDTGTGAAPSKPAAPLAAGADKAIGPSAADAAAAALAAAPPAPAKVIRPAAGHAVPHAAHKVPAAAAHGKAKPAAHAGGSWR